MERNKIIDIFASLGDRLAGFGDDPSSYVVMCEAGNENGWFSTEDIRMAVNAIRIEMLDPAKLSRWAMAYPLAESRRNVRVIMAGNIPLAGFFDMLCVAVSGHKCYYKASSKDRRLIDYVAGLLHDIHNDVEIYPTGDEMAEAVIASGSDNTMRHLRDIYLGLPSVLRGSRMSAAVLDGRENKDDIEGLGRDIFSYSGLGCRNVSHLVLPRGYDVHGLVVALKRSRLPSVKYYNNYRQRKAELTMNRDAFIDGNFFVMREGKDFPTHVSEISYRFYDGDKEVSDWVESNNSILQCIVGRGSRMYVPPGRAQYPRLSDYPDGIDIMHFLSEL